MYHGGHFDDFFTKFVNYKIDYFDFCDADLMSIFEIGSMLSEAVGDKSVAFDLYFKSPNEGMELVGKLETDNDIMLMTSLLSKEVKYVEVFAVLIEPIEVEGLQLRSPTMDKPTPVVELEREVQTPVVKKKNIKKVAENQLLRRSLVRGQKLMKLIVKKRAMVMNMALVMKNRVMPMKNNTMPMQNSAMSMKSSAMPMQNRAMSMKSSAMPMKNRQCQ